MTAWPAYSLFEQHAPRLVRTGFELRDYQVEDVEALMHLRSKGVRSCICRWATGLGKSVLLADLTRELIQHGRVMITVDASVLARDLVDTLSIHLGGHRVGVCTGETKDLSGNPSVIVSTVQTLYSKDETGEPRYRRMFKPDRFAALLVDECETSLAEEYSGVVEHFKQNPDCFIMGTTATPFRGDGTGMGRLYQHAESQAGVLNRDILWGRDYGWLVNVRQGFVHTHVDFSSLKVRKDDSGERDYSDADLAGLISDERTLIELAHGIYKAAAGEPGIVICPNSTELAEKLAWHMGSVEQGCAEAVHGKQGRRSDDLIDAYKRGDFPFLVSVNKLYKGFDADRVRHVFMARKTKSRRLYEQAMGRGTRPLKDIRDALNASDDEAERRAIIAASDKPHMTMWDLAGVSEKAKDLLGVIDILHGSASAEVRQKAKAKLLKSDQSEDVDTAARDAEKQVAKEAAAKEKRERQRRERLAMQSHVTTEVTDDLGARNHRSIAPDLEPATPKQRWRLATWGIDGEGMSKRQASIIIGKRMQGQRVNPQPLPEITSF